MKKIISILIIFVILFAMFSSYISVYADDEIEWADFSDATFGLKENNVSGGITYYYSIENIKNVDNSTTLYYLITDNTTEPTMDVNEWNICMLRPDEGKIEIDSTHMANYLELEGDFYLWIFQQKFANSQWNNNMLVSAKKIEKISVPSNPKAFFATFLSDNNTQLILNAPKGKDTIRKINVKIGKIEDNTILNSIKNNEASCFDNLLTYAKNANTIYSNTLNADSESNMIDYTAYHNSDRVIELYSLLENKTYYYLYVNVDDENGKYIPVEAVTLAKSSIYSYNGNSYWGMFFYGSNDFNWDGLNTSTTITEGDDTTAPTIIPFAGINIVTITTMAGIVLIGVVTYKKYRSLKDVK